MAGENLDPTTTNEPSDAPSEQNSAAVGSTDVSNRPAAGVNVSTDKTGAVDPGRLEQLEKSYKELQGAFTRTAQDRSSLQKQLSSFETTMKAMAENLAKQSEKPYDPDEFMANFRSDGPKFLQSQFEKLLQAKETAWQESVAQERMARQKLEIDWTVDKCKRDTTNFPDFEKLEPEMVKAHSDPATPIDRNLPTEDYVRALFNYVRLQHSQDALKAASAAGKSKAEKELARESATAVAGGGKVTSPATPDLWKMPIEKLEKYINDTLGTAER